MRSLIIIGVALVLSTRASNPRRLLESLFNSSKGTSRKATKFPTSTGASRVDEMRGGPEGEEAPPVANPTSPAKVVETCYLNYTTPLGSSDENGDLGGIVAYAKKLALDEASSMEYAMDYIYFWDSADKCLVPPRSSSLVEHISTIEHGLYNSEDWASHPQYAATMLWGYLYDETRKLEEEMRFYQCPEIETKVGDERVVITLAARGSGQLKFHEIEVSGTRTKTCEEQLFEYAKEIGNGGSGGASSLILGSGDRKRYQLRAAAASSFLKSIRGKNGKAGKEKNNRQEDPDRHDNRDEGEVSSLPGAYPVDEAGGEPAVPRTTVVNFCSLAYTCPLGSPDDKQDLGGVEAHVKGLALEEDHSSVEYALDYLYFWDSSRHNNTLTSANVLLDVNDIIPHEPSMDDKEPCSKRILRWGYGWLMGIRGTTVSAAQTYVDNERPLPPKPTALIDHISSLEEEAQRSYYIAFDPKRYPAYLWPFVYYEGRLQEQREPGLSLCPKIAADVGNEKVTVTLRGNFLLPSGKSWRKLRIHEVEVLGSLVWKTGDIKGKHVDMLHEIEKRTPGVKEGLSADMCEDQLFEYGKEIGKLKAEKHDASFAGVLGSGAKRKTQLQAAVALIYHALMTNDL
ncbi:hypothetical protein FOZ63_015371 [Perkinsus olseni]|uniref:Uncharacterized protein n=1 Tax=Perkinsus olseni TaxID=32597 RepID=A0A7J6PV11_PEROL|nr:hypothetical protein FOZ63_015371 [Perkinsus olseni]